MEKNYTKLAHYYDTLQSEIDYNIWFNWVMKFKVENILEIGCGTGKLANMLANNKVKIDGFDLSLEMVEVAKEKNPGLNLYVDDISYFETDKKYDLIICFMDTINYLITKENIELAFCQMSKALKRGGKLLFDLHKIGNIENFDNYLESGFVDEDFYRWSSKYYDEKNGLVKHSFEFNIDGEIFLEEHIQKIELLKYYKKIYDQYFIEKNVFEDDYRMYIELERR